MTMRKLVQIVPMPAEPSGLVVTSGTKVMIDGKELEGVTKIVLLAEPNDIWKAEIHCHVNMQPMNALAVVHFPKPWWRRLLDWVTGD
jgi:hypothetical protein